MSSQQAKVHIITDSFALFTDPYFLQKEPVTVLPNRLSIAGKTYREGIDLSQEEMMRLMAKQPYAPAFEAPSTQDFKQAFEQAARSVSKILSIHPSRKVSKSYANALSAAEQLVGRIEIQVVDSGCFSAGQGMFIEYAAKLLKQSQDFEWLSTELRNAVERIYVMLYTDSLQHLVQNQLIEPSHQLLGEMLGIKPILTIEEGEIAVIEKTKTRGQLVEHIAEFVLEFADIEAAVIIQPRHPSFDFSRMLHEYLAVELPDVTLSSLIYGPSLASFIGDEGGGVIIFERNPNRIKDVF